MVVDNTFQCSMAPPLGNPFCRPSTVEHWQSLLTLGRDISIDEALLLWMGTISWKQFIRTKPARFGIKTFALADACTGYLWNSIIFMRDDTMINQDLNFTYQATNIVMSLAKVY